MEINLNYDILRILFKFLNGTDLSNASQVCRSWLEAANDENKTRSPLCIIKSRKRTRTSFSFNVLKNEMIKYLTFKPTFTMFFVASEQEDSSSENCHCEYLSYNSSSVSLSTCNSFLMKEKDHIVGTFFPKVPNVQISMLSFNKHPMKNGIYCEELKTLFDISFNNAEQLKTIFEVVFNKDSHKTNCLILLYKYLDYGFLIPLNLFRCFKNWFPYARTSVWGGVVEKLSICNSLYNSSVCKNNVECVAILISGTEIQTWSLCLNKWYDTEKKIEDKFKIFKDDIKFKKQSIGLMFTSNIRDRFLYNLESTIFKRFFPSIPLVEYFGNNVFAGEIFNVTYERRFEAMESINTTAFIILTYN